MTSIKFKEEFELLRDMLRMYTNFLEELIALEKEHHIDTSQTKLQLASVDSAELLEEIIRLEPSYQSKFLKVALDLIKIQPLRNPIELSHKDKLDLVNKLNSIARDMELIFGISKITSTPTDIEEQLIERCKGKDYHDVVTNAFPLLEDRIREKAGADRSCCGDKLIDFALNPESGRLILGDSAAEREGAYFLFKGAMRFLRNPPSHTLTVTVDEGRNAAIKVMYMVDLLIKLLDKARSRSDI